MDGSTTRRLTSDNKDSLIQDFVVKKYSCMYTPDLQKHKKVWHDGFVKLHHKNSKIYLISEDGHPLAERFLKVSSVRISRCLPNSDRGENSKNSASSSPGSTSTAQFQQQLPDGFELFEDEEIDFDGIEDSEARNLAYLARIEKLDKIEKEVRSLNIFFSLCNSFILAYFF
ncbi:hypothetical protein BY996DRAFT_6997057 [Phakopsora pachyrhizi]|nr:hypothetical protein BY996DRAFT_6997057 [Phakopsora pachyrhizi]